MMVNSNNPDTAKLNETPEYHAIASLLNNIQEGEEQEREQEEDTNDKKVQQVVAFKTSSNSSNNNGERASPFPSLINRDAIQPASSFHQQSLSDSEHASWDQIFLEGPSFVGEYISPNIDECLFLHNQNIRPEPPMTQEELDLTGNEFLESPGTKFTIPFTMLLTSPNNIDLIVESGDFFQGICTGPTEYTLGPQQYLYQQYHHTQQQHQYQYHQQTFPPAASVQRTKGVKERRGLEDTTNKQQHLFAEQLSPLTMSLRKELQDRQLSMEYFDHHGKKRRSMADIMHSVSNANIMTSESKKRINKKNSKCRYKQEEEEDSDYDQAEEEEDDDDYSSANEENYHPKRGRDKQQKHPIQTPKKKRRQSSGSSSTMSTSSSSGRKSKNCEYPGCEKGARSKGLCKRHGGGKRCTFPTCSRSDQGGGFCIAHGGGKRCSVKSCKNSAQSRGLCKSHGGGRRCSISGCVKSSQEAGLCRSHGGGRLCKFENCNMLRGKNGYCGTHVPPKRLLV